MTTRLEGIISGPRPVRSNERHPVAAPALLRHTTRCGLRVVLAPDPDQSATGVAVVYGVGYRSESRSGLAHLFEHLMFQGSANVERGQHNHLINANGGTANGMTQRDHTSFYAIVPAQALELVLFLESDRMRSASMSSAAIATQIEVVDEEIRRNVLNQPYGGFPSMTVPETLYRDYANTHNGYGDLDALASVTRAECQAFFARHYRPDNAVLAITGRVDVDDALAMVERQFGGFSPAAPDLAARAPVGVELSPHHEVRHDALAAMPALAVTWPAPPARSAHYLPTLVVAAALADGDSARLRRTLVHERGLALQVSALPGLSGHPFDSRDPDLMTVAAVHPRGEDADAIVDAVLAELRRLGTDGLGPEELRRTKRRLAGSWRRELDSVGTRARRLAAAELLLGDCALVTEAPDELDVVTAPQVQAAAHRLARTPHGVLTLTAGRAA